MIDRISAALALGLLAASAAAQETAPQELAPAPSAAWGFFDARCLLPFEEDRPADTAGLVPGDATGDGEVYADPDTGLTLALAEEQGLESCSVEVPASDAAALDAAFALWGEDALASGRYLPDGELALRSADWRSPPIRVLLLQAEAGEPAALAVEEVADEA